MRTANGYDERPQPPGERCFWCGQPCFVRGIWHKNRFRIIPPDTDVHDPYCEAFHAKQCCNCGEVEVSLHAVGPLTAAG